MSDETKPVWQPDPTLGELLSLQLTDIREPVLVRLQREEWPRIQNEYAERGFLGGPVLGSLGDAAGRAVAEMGDKFVNTIVPSVVDFSGGRLPPGAADWLRSTFEEQIAGAAESLARTIANNPILKSLGASALQMARERVVVAATGYRRQLEIRLKMLELSERLRSASPATASRAETSNRSVDAFISYATEDGAEVARPLADELKRRGLQIWIDEAELRVGASLLDTIQRAIARSRFGVVVLTPAFLRRTWPRQELNAFATIAMGVDRTVILPIWHGVDEKMLREAGAVFLADVKAIRADEGTGRLADIIEREVREA